MNTKDVEREVGLTKHTLRYYENEGLIHPSRQENGYRDYDEKDITVLRMVKFMRGLNISIDDIKAYIAGKISFDQCLKASEEYLENQHEKIEEILKEIKIYQEKDLPTDVEVGDLKTYVDKKGHSLFDIKKTTPYVSLGRKVTPQWAKRQMLYALVSAFILSAAYVFWAFSLPTLTKIITALISFVVLFWLFIGMAFRNTSQLMLDQSMNQHIEFHRDTIEYYRFKGPIKNFIYMYDIITNNNHHHRFLKVYRYDEIECVEIYVKRRYMKFSMIAMDVFVVDFKFYFNDGISFYFYWPMILENDGMFVSRILKRKVKNINDPYHILDALEKGENITDYMKGMNKIC